MKDAVAVRIGEPVRKIIANPPELPVPTSVPAPAPKKPKAPKEPVPA